MSNPILGLHHVTAIAGDPQANLDFYAGVLGLRLIKKTVNFDDPSTYHLYYGDGVGTPGTVMTFFPWPGVRRGELGTGQTRTTAFAVPEQSLEFWRHRLEGAGVSVEAVSRFGVSGLACADPDGLRLELVASARSDDRDHPWRGSSVPADAAIRGFDSVALMHSDPGATRRLLVEIMGLREVGADGSRVRLESGDGGPGTFVDLVHSPGSSRGRVAGGSVHHIAFRVEHDEAQAEWLDHLYAAGHPTTGVRDRMYFHSIYFREPGGVLFELATDNPGFTTDESVDDLGSDLKLPPWLETARDRIEGALPRLEGPMIDRSGAAA